MVDSMSTSLSGPSQPLIKCEISETSKLNVSQPSCDEFPQNRRIPKAPALIKRYFRAGAPPPPDRTGTPPIKAEFEETQGQEVNEPAPALSPPVGMTEDHAQDESLDLQYFVSVSPPIKAEVREKHFRSRAFRPPPAHPRPERRPRNRGPKKLLAATASASNSVSQASGLLGPKTCQDYAIDTMVNQQNVSDAPPIQNHTLEKPSSHSAYANSTASQHEISHASSPPNELSQPPSSSSWPKLQHCTSFNEPLQDQSTNSQTHPTYPYGATPLQNHPSCASANSSTAIRVSLRPSNDQPSQPSAPVTKPTKSFKAQSSSRSKLQDAYQNGNWPEYWNVLEPMRKRAKRKNKPHSALRKTLLEMCHLPDLPADFEKADQILRVRQQVLEERRSLRLGAKTSEAPVSVVDRKRKRGDELEGQLLGEKRTKLQEYEALLSCGPLYGGDEVAGVSGGLSSGKLRVGE